VVDYRGILDNTHFAAVVRAALCAHGFSYDGAALERERGDWQALGLRLRDHLFPTRFPAFVDAAGYHAIADIEPYLWDHLPRMAALGYHQARALAALTAGDPGDERVAILGAAFNSAISIIDYLVDERPDCSRLFDLIAADLVSAIFDHTDEIEALLAAAHRHEPEPRLQLVLTLVGLCASEGRALLRASGNRAAWAGLGESIVRQLEAERRVSLGEPAQPLSDLRAKSVLPSVAMLQIAALASPAPAPPLRPAETLGQIFWRVDDLVDLLDDCQRKRPGALLLRLDERLRSERRPCVADADLYQLVDEAAGELLALFDASAFGVDAATAAPLMEFARRVVAGWTDWPSDDPPPKTQTGARPFRGDRPALAAVEMLLAQQRADYTEAIHHLHFPRADRRYETHPALLSFRAVALDGLLDARDAGLPVPAATLAAEVMAILRVKHRDVRGGWSYIPEVTELPPDTDDLGQVLQALQRVGGSTLAATCDDGVRLALDAIEPDGGIHTWILDPRGRSPGDAAIRGYLEVMGGWGVHCEVVANLVAGLLYQRPRYEAVLARVAEYLVSVQDAAGSWTSKWYTGPYYGTFKVAAVLTALMPGIPARARAREFLHAQQRSDGGWGEVASEPLSTALALLALSALGDRRQAASTRGVEYLLASQQPDGGWSSQPWILFPTVDGQVVYGSRTMTTTFCLKALLAR